ncbi:hypothetical protein [Wenxinia marina]|uniref:Uncharacterized protein n=1 Tax=Wenxinia marina DSM 24838 TaxID=1123501 RepID=A0A0D0QFR7_9RHOB|nr:hypothetical protein [Wenxinia marina]KIQ69873.1 hypothetical protein Wenmar_01443 [Wenxinia marina DSM 24838]GGL61870.1 hypothetical protein GCM10011392_15460 [Wenxinia marina]
MADQTTPLREALRNATARELFDLARHLGAEAQFARASGGKLLRMSEGDLAQMILTWAEGPRPAGSAGPTSKAEAAE